MKTSITRLARRSLAPIAVLLVALFVATTARAQTSFGRMRAEQPNAPAVPDVDEPDADAPNRETPAVNRRANASRPTDRSRQAAPNASKANEPQKDDDEQAVDAQTQAKSQPARSQNARPVARNDQKTNPNASAAENAKGLGPILGAPVSHKYRAGIMFQARPGGACTDVFGSVPVPMEFPEQKVRTLAEDFPAKVRVAYRDLKEGGARQLVFKMRELKPGEPIEATSLFEVTRYPILPPSDTSLYLIPKQVPNDVKRYLKDGKYMQSNSKTIKSLVKGVINNDNTDSLVKANSKSDTTESIAKKNANGEKTAWEKVDAILNYVRTNIQYKDVLVEKQMRGALDALRSHDGDCEDMSALFIAMCRAIDVPARLVRVPNHCWAEFYLVDADKNGYWFPAQVAGTDKLGELQDTRVILQKGDSFRLPESPREETLYVKELFTGKVKENGPDPMNVFIQEVDGK